MSERERYISLLDEIEEDQLIYIVNMIQTFVDTAKKKHEDEEDMRLSLELLERYENDPDKDEFIPLEEVMKELGLTQEDIDNAGKDV